jgi:probable rRNA maturation factor
VLLSYPRAAIQARERRHSLEQELALLVIHGVLHLLGYQDEDAAAEARMRAAEKRVLGEMSNEPPL